MDTKRLCLFQQGDPFQVDRKLDYLIKCTGRCLVVFRDCFLGDLKQFLHYDYMFDHRVRFLFPKSFPRLYLLIVAENDYMLNCLRTKTTSRSMFSCCDITGIFRLIIQLSAYFVIFGYLANNITTVYTNQQVLITNKTIYYIYKKKTGTTGFEPAFSCVTGRYVWPATPHPHG